MNQPSRLTVRALRTGDVDAAARLLLLTSASGIQHLIRAQLGAALSGERGAAFVAERDGTVDGAALLSTDPVFPGSLVTLVAVAEHARGSGAGTALGRELGERLAGASLPAWCQIRDDLPDGRRFAEQRGFAVRYHSLGWSLDLAAPGERGLEATASQAADRAGVRVRVADVPTEFGVIADCARRAVAGIPGDQNADPDQARDRFPADAIVLLAERAAGGAEAAPRAIGLTIVAPQVERAAWYTMFTGVDPDFRKGGVARALKTESFARARRAGALSILTHNHETNEAIIKLNESLGMRPALGYWDMRRPVPA
jgi:GNAT superfamily N-acetyltransferase